MLYLRAINFAKIRKIIIRKIIIQKIIIQKITMFVSRQDWQILAFASIYCKCRYLIACAHCESLQTCYSLQAFKFSFRQFTNPLYYSTTKRRVWDSNPRALADNLISSQARCDHFDTSPCKNMQFL